MEGIVYFAGFAIAILLPLGIFITVSAEIWRRKGGAAWRGALLGCLGPIGLIFVIASKPLAPSWPRADRVSIGVGDVVMNRKPIYMAGTDPIGAESRMVVTGLIDRDWIEAAGGDGEKRRVPRSSFVVARRLEDRTKVCPACAETVRLAATTCRFCGHFFEGGGPVGP